MIFLLMWYFELFLFTIAIIMLLKGKRMEIEHKYNEFIKKTKESMDEQTKMRLENEENKK